MSDSINELVARVREGDACSLEKIVREIQDRIYSLSVRMLGPTPDAEDATQEILILVITNLSSFRMESRFTTWVYRIAVNYLINLKKKRSKPRTLSLDACSSGSRVPVSEELSVQPEGEKTVMKIATLKACFQATVLCLPDDLRLTYMLSSAFGITGEDGAEIFGISPAAYRKRLSRARARVAHFLQDSCAIFNDEAECNCAKAAEFSGHRGTVTPDLLLRAILPVPGLDAGELPDSLGKLESLRADFVRSSILSAPAKIAANIKRIIPTHAGLTRNRGFEVRTDAS